MNRCLRTILFRHHKKTPGTTKIAHNLIKGDTCDRLFAFEKNILELDYEGNALITLVV